MSVQIRPRTLTEFQAFAQLRLLPTQEYSTVAADLLVRGEESEPLVFLAGLGLTPNPFEAAELLEKAVQSSGLARLEEVEAVTVVAQRIASAVLDGSIPPYEGAQWIWRELWSRFHHPDLLIDFMILAHEIDDLRPVELEGRRAELETEIRDVCAKLMKLEGQPGCPPEGAQNGR